jgi:uncharacterized RDD family membrane protein YckC
MERGDIGSWLSGPRIDTGMDGEVGYPGERLGLPEKGIGSVAGWGQRLGAICIDWFVALGVTMAVLGAPEPGDDVFSLVVLGFFCLEYVVLLLTAGRTIGMAVAGFHVYPVGSDRLSPVRVVLRTLLLALVVPAVVYDRDRRGLHDKAARTVTIRTR